MTLTSVYIILTHPERSYTPETLLDEIAKERTFKPEDKDQLLSLISLVLEDMVSEHMAERIKSEGDCSYRAILPHDRAAFMERNF